MIAFLIAAFAAGVVVGLIIGPDSEREYRRHVDGWLDGYRFAKSNEVPRSSNHPLAMSAKDNGQ